MCWPASETTLSCAAAPARARAVAPATGLLSRFPCLHAGPLVYPAGFVYVYAALRRLTGGAVAAAQPLFAALYVATLAVVLSVYVRARVVPPAALPLLCLSKRLHSIYVLRLFNDGVAMLPAFGAVALAQRGRWCVCRDSDAPLHVCQLTPPPQAGCRLGLERCRQREDERAAFCAGAGVAHAARSKHEHNRRCCFARCAAAGVMRVVAAAPISN